MELHPLRGMNCAAHQGNKRKSLTSKQSQLSRVNKESLSQNGLSQNGCTLEIRDFGDFVQKNSMFVNLCIKLALHEVYVPQCREWEDCGLRAAHHLAHHLHQRQGRNQVVSPRTCSTLEFLIGRDPGVLPKLILQRLFDNGDFSWD